MPNTTIAPITLAQITDTHLLATPTAELRGCNPWQTFQAVLQQLARHCPDGLLLTGDLADQGSEAAYRQLRSGVQSFKCPVYWLPGNHDDLPTLRSVFQAPQFYGLEAITLGNWRLLLLNSVKSDDQWGGGYLAADQLQWLHQALSRYPQNPTLIALHHHPVPTDIDWLDQISIQNATEFLTLLDHYPQVRLVVFGHIHQQLHRWRDRERKGSREGRVQGAIAFYGCPSTCLQVTPTFPAPLDHLPGFRLIYLYPNGDYHTQVERVQPLSSLHHPYPSQPINSTTSC